MLVIGVADCVGIYLANERLDNAVPDEVRYAPIAYTAPAEFSGGSGSAGMPQLAQAPVMAVPALAAAPAAAAAAARPAVPGAGAAAANVAAPQATESRLAARAVTAKVDTPASFASLTSPIATGARARAPLLEDVVERPAPARKRTAKLARPARASGFDAAFGSGIVVNNQLENELPVLDLAEPNAAEVDLAQYDAGSPEVLADVAAPVPAAAGNEGELPALDAAVPAGTPAG